MIHRKRKYRDKLKEVATYLTNFYDKYDDNQTFKVDIRYTSGSVLTYPALEKGIIEGLLAEKAIGVPYTMIESSNSHTCIDLTKVEQIQVALPESKGDKE